MFRSKLIHRCYNSLYKTIKSTMANTKFEYVKSFELEDKLAPLNWIVLSVKCLEQEDVSKSDTMQEHQFHDVMSTAVQNVMSEMKEICLGYGFGNIYHFVLQKDTHLFKRRGFKILSNITSLFTSSFVVHWNSLSDSVFKVPLFDGSLYLLPQDQCLRDFLTKEQHDCHLNNLKETTLHHLIRVTSMEYSEALKKVQEANEGEKNEMLFSICKINYNNEDIKNKKGTILIRSKTTCKEKQNKSSINAVHSDFNKDDFWASHFHLESKTENLCKFNYLSALKMKQQILPHTFLVVRIDGKGFHRFSELHNFEKPNDRRSLSLMTTAAQFVMKNYPKIIIAYGQSDEYSFVFNRYGHREKDGNALISRVVSLFTGAFVSNWKNHFGEHPLLLKPVFDARLVLYPSVSSIRDYLCWRQADCHINNMYNTCFWKLVNEKCLSRRAAQEYLNGTFSKDKVAILKNEFSMDYSDEESWFRKGTVVYVDSILKSGDAVMKVEHSDIIQDKFWKENPDLLMKERETVSNNMEL